MGRFQQAALSHAHLMIGRPGVGKRHFVDVLAQSILCLQPDDEGVACGKCHSCGMYSVGSHPDFLRVEPEDAESAIKVDQIRALEHELLLKPQFGGYKVALIDRADQMTMQAANSLLKTLEEPPSHVLMFLVSSHFSSLPATILSRCQKIKFTVPDADMAHNWLAGQVDTDVASLLAAARGCPLYALELHAADTLSQQLGLIQELDAMLHARITPVELCAKWSAIQSIDLFALMLAWFRDLYRLQLTGDVALVESKYAEKVLQAWVTRFDRDGVLRYCGVLEKAYVQQNKSLNLQVQLESIMVDLLALRR